MRCEFRSSVLAHSRPVAIRRGLALWSNWAMVTASSSTSVLVVSKISSPWASWCQRSTLLPFSAWAGRWKQPLRVTGPSGRTPDLGTNAMVAGMKQMLKWHIEALDACPIGDSYEVEVNEFDWKDENGICYDKNGVTIRHWRRSHVRDGASAYRLG